MDADEREPPECFDAEREAKANVEEAKANVEEARAAWRKATMAEEEWETLEAARKQLSEALDLWAPLEVLRLDTDTH